MSEEIQFHQAVMERGDSAVLVVDADELAVRWASPAALRLFGTASGVFPDLVDPADAAAVASFLQAAIGRDSASRGTCAVPVEGSTARRVDLVARDLSADPVVGGLVVVALDVTGWAERSEELGRRLGTDGLTGVANRAGLLPRLEQAARGAPDSGPGPVLMFLDLDGFKTVNDRYGHAAGDRVLRGVAAHLDAVVTGRGTVARVGGDEFVVLLDRSDEQEAVAFAQEAVNLEFTVAGDVVRVTASAGIMVVRRGYRAESLLHRADLAMYRAKATGRAHAVVYRDDLQDWVLARKLEVDRLAERLEHMRLEKEALVEAATIDQRTGLPNPAAFDADHDLQNRRGRPYSLLLVDIDHFHDYNTLYRYLAGHEALRKVGQAIRRAVRTTDRTYRYGGEEFTVLLPDARLPEATAVGERVRLAVEQSGIEHRGNPGGVLTVSVGVVEAEPGATVTDVIEEASIALLGAKDTGRNQVIGRTAHTPRPPA
ncbi:diguanylate cyclase (GGDEF)-like protein [Saccharothrix tamanrassetensis]|uniref:Diguanylate cyclase (GGDEF)-like protein n=1 Tax=Saccharothrix tamanrassetensis TaxID=1051531 RepID=A0A841CX12_9PSEU|nr:diguanylate cyclase [Saccharothrix tamanrassetensis]MBB5960475.1 diguanylate cyclase (GGDEF)-like protein [Saccharothrix tamanrassetensis]